MTLAAMAAFTSIAVSHEGHEHAAKPVQEKIALTGNGSFTYKANSSWGKVKEGEKLGPTHGSVVIDEAGLVYVSTDGPQSIFVFKKDGSPVKTFPETVRGLHHMQIRKEGEKEFIYGAKLNAYGGKTAPKVVKFDLEGNVVLEIPNASTGEVQGGFKGVTGIAVSKDGSIFVSIGYGSNLIHKFDQAGKLIKTFGGRGQAVEKFRTPHTLSIDTRFGDERLLIADREKRRLVHYDLDGKFIGVYASNLRRPCAVSFYGEFCAVAELESRVVILDKSGTPVSFVGDNSNKKQWANFGVKPADQKRGIFSAPHGLSFDKEGNLYVQDWNTTGRVTQLLLQK